MPICTTHSGLSRRARRVLLWLAVVFVLGQVAFLALRETIMPEFRDPEYAMKLGRLRRCLRQRNQGTPLIVALGSSRVSFGLRPDELEVNRRSGPGPVVFNAGICRAFPVGQMLCARRLWADGIRPDVVLVELWPGILPTAAAQVETDIGVSRLTWGEQRLLQPFTSDPDRWLQNWLASVLLPVYGSRHIVLNCFVPDLVPEEDRFDENWAGMTEGGWLPHPAYAESPSLAEVRERIEGMRNHFQARFTTLSVSETSDRALRQLLADCRAHQARVAIVLMPEPEPTRSWYTPRCREQFQHYLDELAREYGTAVIDAREWVEDTGFRECVHLTHEGARQFTLRFEREALPEILSGRLWQRREGAPLSRAAPVR